MKRLDTPASAFPLPLLWETGTEDAYFSWLRTWAQAGDSWSYWFIGAPRTTDTSATIFVRAAIAWGVRNGWVVEAPVHGGAYVALRVHDAGLFAVIDDLEQVAYPQPEHL